MENVLLIVHLLLALAIIGLVLIQRSEGGGLGMGGSGGGLGNFATPRATANALTRATAWCAAAFFVTSLVLGILAGTHSRSAGILDTYGTKPPVQQSAPPSSAPAPDQPVGGSAPPPVAPGLAKPDSPPPTEPAAPVGD